MGVLPDGDQLAGRLMFECGDKHLPLLPLGSGAVVAVAGHQVRRVAHLGALVRGGQLGPARPALASHGLAQEQRREALGNLNGSNPIISTI